MEWVSAITAELRKLGSPHEQKKRATIIAIIDARLSGRPEESVWKMATTCSRTTYHKNWKKQDVFAGVLSTAWETASDYDANKALRALEEAKEALAIGSPKAVELLIALVKETDDPTNARLAAVAILDRAGMETAPKKTTALPGLDDLLGRIWDDDEDDTTDETT